VRPSGGVRGDQSQNQDSLDWMISRIIGVGGWLFDRKGLSGFLTKLSNRAANDEIIKIPEIRKS
jgi:hypothetical protein